MKRTEVSFPELGLIAATRGMLGAGIALLLSDLLSAARRRAVGWPLFLIGALSTIPLAFLVFGHRRRGTRSIRHESVERSASGRNAHRRRRQLA